MTWNRAEHPVLSVRDVSKHYRRGRGVTGASLIRALDHLSLDLCEGEILSLLGPSGCGKSTLGRCMAFLECPDEGEIHFRGQEIDRDDPLAIRMMRRKVQLVFQDPVTSVNPQFTVAQALEEPFRIGERLAGLATFKIDRLESLLEEVGLSSSMLKTRARSLSGGQIQRLVLARALATEPEILILDESLSGLDLSLQARLANLILELLDQRTLTCVLITHNASLAAHLADRVVRMDQGGIVDQSSSDVVPQ